MCDCYFDVSPIVEELKLHRPIIPAPGWRVFHAYLSEDAEDGLQLNEYENVLGWQMQNDGSFRLVICTEYFTRVVRPSDNYVILKPGAEVNRKKTLDHARWVVAWKVEKQFKGWSDKKKETFRKLFPGNTSTLKVQAQPIATLINIDEFCDRDDNELEVETA